MYTIKAVLDTRHKSKSGLYPIKVRITLNRRSWYRNTGLKAKKQEWSSHRGKIKPSHSLSKQYNALLLTFLRETEETVLEQELQEPMEDILQVKALFEKPKPQDFLSYGKYLVKTLEDQNRHGSARFYLQAISKLEKQVQQVQFSFSNMNHAFLRDWETSMLNSGISKNAIAAYYRAIRAISNHAIKDGLVKQEWYPFHHFSITTEETKDRSLSLEQLRALHALEPVNEQEKWAKNLFFLSFALIGMNFSDMAELRADNLVTGRLEYTRLKTKKKYSIKLHPYTQDLMKEVRRHRKTDYYLLPILMDESLSGSKKKASVKQRLKLCNKYLGHLGARIGIPELTSYYARYTWANIAIEHSADRRVIGAALGHSVQVSTTDIYLADVSQKTIDELALLTLKQLLQE